LEPFLYEKDVSVRWVKDSSEIGRPDAVIIPGTKSTMNDLNFIRVKQLDNAIQKHLEEGGFLVGICGGYQILGEELIDEAGSDTGIASLRVQGLGIIPARTFFQDEKETVRTAAHFHEDTDLSYLGRLEGYEIHLGRTILAREGCSFLQTIEGKSDGYYGENGKVIGTYLHHLFHNDRWRNQWLNMIRKSKGLPTKEVVHIKDFKDQRFDDLANQMKEHINWELLTNIINRWSSRV
jgi:adenosylcobyric acid synthase